MPPAARVSDSTTHGTPLTPGPGSLNVMIGGMPAWRGIPAAAAGGLQAAQTAADTAMKTAETATKAAAGTPGAPAAAAAEQTLKTSLAISMGSMMASFAGMSDIHVCPVLVPVPPHGPGVVTDGSPTVQINHMPACRQGDTVLEALGGGDKIVLGCPTVIIGNSGGGGGGGGAPVPAVPPGFLEELKGFVAALINQVAGSAPSIRKIEFNADGSISFGKGIKILPNPAKPDFQGRALAALIRLDSTPTGNKMFSTIDGSGQVVTLGDYGPGLRGYYGPNNATTTREPGNGATGSHVSWDPNLQAYGADEASKPGSDIILGHELVHATHNATGTHGQGPYWNSSNVGEERSTVGLPATTFNDPNNANEPLNGTKLPDTTGGAYSENQLRADYANMGMTSPATGKPPIPRPSYTPPGSGGVPGQPF